MNEENYRLGDATYIIQGSDFKARRWMEPFGAKAQFFISAQDLLRILIRPGRKHVIFRYQNSSPRMVSDLAYTLVIVMIAAIRRLIKTEIYWIMHNIDRETVDKFPVLTRIRRAILTRSSRLVLVTDPMFKSKFFPATEKVRSISFGPKSDGVIDERTLDKIAELREEYDLVAMCLGAVGDKYVHYRCLEHLTALAAQHGRALLLILPAHSNYEGKNAIKINETNIDENALTQYVDFIYRINDDISMPYTVYAACGAQIPLVTGRNYFTFDIVKSYGIGFSEEEYFLASETEITRTKQKMKEFMDSRTWRSLADVLVAGKPA